MKIYSVYDKIGKKHLSITIAETDADFIRQALFALLMDYPIQDIDAYCLGDFFENSGVIVPCSPRLVDWNSYRFPKTADSFEEVYLTFDEIREAALKKKHELDQKLLDKVEDFENLLVDVEKELKREDLSETQRKSLIDYKKGIEEQIIVLKNKTSEVA